MAMCHRYARLNSVVLDACNHKTYCTYMYMYWQTVSKYLYLFWCIPSCGVGGRGIASHPAKVILQLTSKHLFIGAKGRCEKFLMLPINLHILLVSLLIGCSRCVTSAACAVGKANRTGSYCQVRRYAGIKVVFHLCLAAFERSFAIIAGPSFSSKPFER